MKKFLERVDSQEAYPNGHFCFWMQSGTRVRLYNLSRKNFPTFLTEKEKEVLSKPHSSRQENWPVDKKYLKWLNSRPRIVRRGHYSGEGAIQERQTSDGEEGALRQANYILVQFNYDHNGLSEWVHPSLLEKVLR